MMRRTVTVEGLRSKSPGIAPDRYTTSATAERAGRLFLDYLRNGRGTTAVATYSPRARAGFPIAAPTTWQDLERGILPDAFTMAHPFGQRRTRASSRRHSRVSTHLPERLSEEANADEQAHKAARRTGQPRH
jgi:DNA primase